MCSEAKPERDLKIIFLKSLDRGLDPFPNTNRIFEFRIQTRARSEKNNFKSLWITLLIDFSLDWRRSFC